MTQPMQGYFLQVPNTVIGNRPENYDLLGALDKAIAGHQEILDAIHAHAQHDNTLRDLRRQASDAAGL
jgi:hypothetical protein